MGRKKKTKEEFIQEATEKHEGKYDYSKVEYDGAHTKVCIICPDHGEFWQTPTSHLSGSGCPECSVEKVRGSISHSKEEFIKKAKETHGDKYDYTNVEYVNNKTKVCIICPEHGEFWQKPDNHTQGQGCPECGQIARADSQRLSKEDFIKKAREKHKGKYDYSKVDYVNNYTKVCIICNKPNHGEFWQTPSDHLQGKGCQKCKVDKTRERCVSTKEKFIKKAIAIHGDKYDYSKVEYVNANTKVCIICPEHGEFWQRPADHTRGKGCLTCNLSHLERSVMNYLDEAGITYDYQKHFDWLGKQSLDFYLPDYNVGVECQGGQHFFPVEHFGGDEGFKKILERDKRKFKKCQKNGIKILYYSNLGIEYPYDVFEDVDFLFEEIKNSRF